jgi:hypothetical protein
MSANVSPLEHSKTFMRLAPSHSFKSKLGGGPGYMPNEHVVCVCTVQLIESDEDAVGAVRKREVVDQLVQLAPAAAY